MTGIGTSSSWTSPHAEWKSKLERLQQNGHHIGVTNSPFFPKNLTEYLQHKTEYLDDRRRDISKRGARMIASSAADTDINVNHSKVIRFNKKEEGQLVLKDAGDKKAKEPFLTLGEPTVIWDPRYCTFPERREDQGAFGPLTRASWPDQNELKAEGENRLSAFGERRFPLPRRDALSGEAVIADYEAGRSVDELVPLKGENIPWYKRAVVALDGLDKLESTEKEIWSAVKTYNVAGPFSPVRSRLPSGRNTPLGKHGSPVRSPRRSQTNLRAKANFGGESHALGLGGMVANAFEGGYVEGSDGQYVGMMGDYFEQNGNATDMTGFLQPAGRHRGPAGNFTTSGDLGTFQMNGFRSSTGSPSTKGYAHVANRAVSGTRNKPARSKNVKGKPSKRTQSENRDAESEVGGEIIGGGNKGTDEFQGLEGTERELIEQVFDRIFEEED
ncbi:hypothetical protein GLAREA_03575 [Glarea lozoyensis ATCC 20868]|uniref:Uncharacterized protein n=1 Tax=Glarea lozoyensis (strain ATCC 20868 / MF5171) TaxID=1116229 RepID=S3DW37_GLAL2|nr:uncharacterized protein GLAREA_03575 [Glarea lozoyensis ATCC 20868]EPE30608.1 hypothetical protein GLAREA_03575 [Glarea lozoyensis ATCC 20868]